MKKIIKNMKTKNEILKKIELLEMLINVCDNIIKDENLSHELILITNEKIKALKWVLNNTNVL